MLSEGAELNRPLPPPLLAQQHRRIGGSALLAGQWRCVRQALGQRVGSQRAISGVVRSGAVDRFGQSAVEGSKKQSAIGPAWSVRARLASKVRRCPGDGRAVVVGRCHVAGARSLEQTV